MPPAEPTGEYLHLVVSVQPSGDDCALIVDRGAGPERIALTPATLVIRLWRNAASMTLRGSIGLHGSDIVVPIQIGAGLELLLRAWLFDGRSSPGDRPQPS